MNKNFVIALIVLALIITAGVLEITFLGKGYLELADITNDLREAAKNETISLTEFEKFKFEWQRLRCNSEIFLPHIDVYEINFRIAELGSYIETGDYAMAHSQLAQISALLEYVPHLMVPTWQHVL